MEEYIISGTVIDMAGAIAICLVCIAGIILTILVMHTTDGNIIRHYRKMKIPPCSECKYCYAYNTMSYNRIRYCNCPAYSIYYEKLNGVIKSSETTYNVRGTRFCKFEQKETEEK